MYKRVIPIILLDGEDAVKTKSFKNPSYVGDPINILKIFNEKDADEIVFLDINKSRLGLPPDFDFLEELASEAFIPCAYGGGISNLEQATKIFRIGFEKIVAQTSLLNSLFCNEVVERYGRQALVGSIDIVDGDTFKIGKRFFSRNDLRKIIKDSNCGELIFQCISRDGTKEGLDFDLLKFLDEFADVPIVFSGGCKNEEEIEYALTTNISAIGVGGYFVYSPSNAVLITYYRRPY